MYGGMLRRKCMSSILNWKSILIGLFVLSLVSCGGGKKESSDTLELLGLYYLLNQDSGDSSINESIPDFEMNLNSEDSAAVSAAGASATAASGSIDSAMNSSGNESQAVSRQIASLLKKEILQRDGNDIDFNSTTDFNGEYDCEGSGTYTVSGSEVKGTFRSTTKTSWDESVRPEMDVGDVTTSTSELELAIKATITYKNCMVLGFDFSKGEAAFKGVIPSEWLLMSEYTEIDGSMNVTGSFRGEGESIFKMTQKGDTFFDENTKYTVTIISGSQVREMKIQSSDFSVDNGTPKNLEITTKTYYKMTGSLVLNGFLEIISGDAPIEGFYSYTGTLGENDFSLSLPFSYTIGIDANVYPPGMGIPMEASDTLDDIYDDTESSPGGFPFRGSCDKVSSNMLCTNYYTTDTIWSSPDNTFVTDCEIDGGTWDSENECSSTPSGGVCTVVSGAGFSYELGFWANDSSTNKTFCEDSFSGDYSTDFWYGSN